MDMNNLDDGQKGQLKHCFQEALRGRLSADDARADKAFDTLLAAGFEESDLESLLQEPQKLFSLLGADAINEDLQARLRDADAQSGAFGWGVRPYQGFYPMFEKK